MRVTLAAILGILAIAARAGDIDEGKAIYDSKCVNCHSKDMKGSAAMARKFKVRQSVMDLTSEEVRDTKDEELLAVILTGKSGRMPAFSGKLTVDAAKNVLSYVRSLRGVARGFGRHAKGDADLVAKNFYVAQCSYCHGAGGKGNVGMAQIFKVEQHSMDLTSPQAQALKDEEIAAVIANGKGHMPGFSEKLTPEEIQAMVAYLRQKRGK